VSLIVESLLQERCSQGNWGGLARVFLRFPIKFQLSE